MNEACLYEDREIKISATEVRCQQLTIRTDSITSVSITSAQPLKWLPVIAVIPATPIIFMVFGFARDFGRDPAAFFMPLLIPLTPLLAIGAFASLMRISRIFLQTSGGPIILALKVQFSDPASTLYRFEAIKKAVEQAMGGKISP